MVRDMGRAGIRTFGYNWMPTGVWRTSYTHPLRGGAQGTAFDEDELGDAPLTHDRRYDDDELWKAFEYFLRAVLPVAEEEGVRLALHPNDPPVAGIGGIPFLFRDRAAFERAMALVPSPAHGLIFCLGTWSEMGEDLHAAARHFGARDQLVYAHFQAVSGTVPAFHETFLDEASYDAYEMMGTLREVGFTGVMIPGHVPQIEGDIEWRTVAGASGPSSSYSHPMGGFRSRAFTVGYLRGLLHALNHRP
jgi:mannonate dehydratase